MRKGDLRGHLSGGLVCMHDYLTHLCRHRAALLLIAMLAVVSACASGLANDVENPSTYREGEEIPELANEFTDADLNGSEFDVDLTLFQQPGTPRPGTGLRRPTRIPSGQNVAPASAED